VGKPSDPCPDAFFIGWLPMPGPYRRFLAPLAALLLVLAAATSAALAYLQPSPGSGRWEADERRTFDGLLLAAPYAMLRVPAEEPGGPARTYLLVEEGKFGALPRVQALLGGQGALPARASGTVLHRDGRWMLELAGGEEGLRPLAGDEHPRLGTLTTPPRVVLREDVTLPGEIIDPKCYLGAMKPGGGKTHKACAALCLRGGVPPMLVTRHAGNNESFYLLVTEAGGVANERVLDFVGDRVEVSGRLERHGDLLILQVAADGVRRR
jgi:hypothetical protein